MLVAVKDLKIARNFNFYHHSNVSLLEFWACVRFVFDEDLFEKDDFESKNSNSM